MLPTNMDKWASKRSPRFRKNSGYLRSRYQNDSWAALGEESKRQRYEKEERYPSQEEKFSTMVNRPKQDRFSRPIHASSAEYQRQPYELTFHLTAKSNRTCESNIFDLYFLYTRASERIFVSSQEESILQSIPGRFRSDWQWMPGSKGAKQTRLNFTWVRFPLEMME
jgi:hypothetical protein